MTDKTVAERKKERSEQRFQDQFGSAERVEYFRNLPSEISGRQSYGEVVNAHMQGGGVGRRGPYTSIVPLWWTEHDDFDTMPGKHFKLKYKRTKQSVRERAPHYHARWLEHQTGAA